MSLFEALQTERDTYTGPRCSTCSVLDSLSKEDRKALEIAFADTSFSSSAISRALKTQSITLGISSIGRHRRGECRK